MLSGRRTLKLVGGHATNRLSNAVKANPALGGNQTVAFGATRRTYSDMVHEHFTKPRNVGAFAKTESQVGTAVVGKAACGDVIRLQIKVKDDTIEDVKFKAFGCGSAIASTSFASELIKGMKVKDALNIKNTDIAESLSLPPVKVHCSLLAEDAIKLAIKNYQQKQGASAN
ncbi:putative iron sulfur cluster assembly NifU-like protein [Gregarina niphandrodes]|uniref:Iron-sulfur cluster assembly protein n=1 Tax=Gregarina niphandrodes TaxID=110365 RepID=A0A023AXP3_GRENI|nr:putative iron sulfur cluster assembly NifU-like protein [Gregarina niphandrodes]EZG43070.1 putative iron sulfur cluster assembly NifU-like protein [Gregarina niphandrodes]|eukprot:XP_011133659.1 putative iron sulfur cluster assembly NifU-like protein [Gregarina niphandrodes]